MKVKEILKLSAQLVGRDDVMEYLESGIADDVPNVKAEVQKFLSAYNLTLEGTAMNYEALEKSYVAENVSEVLFSGFPDRPLEIISVNDEFGKNLEYEQIFEKLTFKRLLEKVVIRYRYSPTKRTEEDEFDYDYNKRTTPNAVSMGVVAEYLMICGAVSEAKIWQTQYEKAMLACMRAKGKTVMPKRRWY